MNLEVKKAKTSDALLVAKILAEATKYKLDHQDSSWGSETFTIEEIKHYMKTSTVYVVFLNAEAVATFALQWEDEQIWGPQPPNAGYLHRLAIKDGFHGQELGKNIINWVLGEVAKNDRLFLRLDCNASNTKLCDYYKNLGFVEVTRTKLPSKTTFTVLYEKPI